MHLIAMHEAHPIGGSGGMPPPRKFFTSDLLRSFLVLFWGEIARGGRPTAEFGAVGYIVTFAQTY